MAGVMAFTPSPSSSSVSIYTSRSYNGIHTSQRALISGDMAQQYPSISSSLPLQNSLDYNVASADLRGPGVSYEAVLPPTTTLVGMAFVVVLCVIGSWVWANQVVPTSRAKLAISKSRGEVKEYLDELKSIDILESTKSASVDEMDVAVGTDAILEEIDLSDNMLADQDSRNRKFERWLFADWLVDNKSARKSGRQKEPALPILKEAKWNSGDNPVLAASALIGAGVLFTALTERVASLI